MTGTQQRLQVEERSAARLAPVRAQTQGLNAEQADQVDDWAGRRARAVVAGAFRLPELAQDDGGEVDGFDPETMTGEVDAWPSVLERPYRMGFFTWHNLLPGAFDDSIAEQGGRIPIYVQHAWDWTERPPIGHTRSIAEEDFSDDDGDTRALHVDGRLYPDVPDGLATLHGLAARALREWSIAYLIEEWSAEEDEDNARTIINISRAQLWEASVVLRGANSWTRTENVASGGTSQIERAARLLDVDAAALAPLVEQLRGGGGRQEPAVDPQLAARVAALELRAAAPTFSKLAHQVRAGRE